jgi:site-specific DNA-methyltransferase (adenine-specific)
MNEIINADMFDIDLDFDVDLFIVDPPYGGIISDTYDMLNEDDCVDLYFSIMDWCADHSKIGTTLYLFGGVGKYKMRPLFKFLSEVERCTKWYIKNYITWSKRRGYGVKDNYIFTREEIVFFVYGTTTPLYFNVPYLNEIRSDDWIKRLSTKKYKPKNIGYKRRTNIFNDITEIMGTKKCRAEKPEMLYDVLINTSCPDDGIVVDPMCGSGTTARVCSKRDLSFYCIEKDPDVCEIAKKL